MVMDGNRTGIPFDDSPSTSARRAAEIPSLDQAVMALVLASSGELEQRRQLLGEAIRQVLVRRNVPAEQLQAPRPEIFAAALDALRVCEAREELANVIASSMDVLNGFSVLPSYVDLIKQLSRDECLILRGAPALGRFMPLAHVNLVLPSKQVVTAYRNVIPEEFAEKLAFKPNIPQYMDNLIRLGVLMSPQAEELDNAAYKGMSRMRVVRRCADGTPPGTRVALQPMVIGLSDLGEGFRRACLV
jgi:hypothetical protein